MRAVAGLANENKVSSSLSPGPKTIRRERRILAIVSSNFVRFLAGRPNWLGRLISTARLTEQLREAPELHARMIGFVGEATPTFRMFHNLVQRGSSNPDGELARAQVLADVLESG